MPQRIPEDIGRYVPLSARMGCYHCGTMFLNTEGKYHCDLCFDVFCARCHGSVIPAPHDGDGTRSVITVCSTCSLLCSLFPEFLKTVTRGGGGHLLRAGAMARVDVAAPCQQPQRSSSSLSSSSRGQSGGGHMQRATYTNVPIVLLSWRPLNPDTMLYFGERHRVPLRDVTKVDFGGGCQACVVHTSHGFVYNVRVISSEGAGRYDAAESHALFMHLQRLLQYTERHFSFSPAALSIHPDLCPVDDATKSTSLSSSITSQQQQQQLSAAPLVTTTTKSSTGGVGSGRGSSVVTVSPRASAEYFLLGPQQTSSTAFQRSSSNLSNSLSGHQASPPPSPLAGITATYGAQRRSFASGQLQAMK
eukprot:PhM_4_TR7156/c0_g1_i1/m.50812